MDKKLRAILDEARKRLWKLAEDPRIPEVDRDLASVVGDLMEDIAHCGFKLDNVELEDGSSCYVVRQPAETLSAAGDAGK